MGGVMRSSFGTNSSAPRGRRAATPHALCATADARGHVEVVQEIRQQDDVVRSAILDVERAARQQMVAASTPALRALPRATSSTAAQSTAVICASGLSLATSMPNRPWPAAISSTRNGPDQPVEHDAPSGPAMAPSWAPCCARTPPRWDSPVPPFLLREARYGRCGRYPPAQERFAENRVAQEPRYGSDGRLRSGIQKHRARRRVPVMAVFLGQQAKDTVR
jgi:hypothetical protein